MKKISVSDARWRGSFWWAYRLAGTAGLCAGLLFARSGSAEEPVDDSTKNAARDLAQRAAQAYEAGDYATAQDLFHRAYALVSAPTLSLREARALEKLGRLVEAAEAYVRTTRTRVAPDSPDVFQQAVKEAHEELAKLRPRIPRLKIIVEGADGSELEVRMDGRPVRKELVGVESPANPGNHAFDAVTRNGAGARGTVALAEGESKSVVLRLEPGKASRQLPAASSAAPAPATGDRPLLSASSGSGQRTFGFVALGVGAAGLGVGVVTGLMAASRHSSAEEGCPNGQCVEGSSAAEDLDAFRTLRTVSTVGYVVGAVGLAGGLTLLLTAPKPQDSAWVSPYLGPGKAGVMGAF
jgi:hypothetical protein